MEDCRIELMHRSQEGILLLYIGIDVHKKSCHACIMDGNGSKLGELKFPNNISGLDKLLKAIDGRRAKAVLESTGNLWLKLYLGLEEAGVEVILSNPSKTKAIAVASYHMLTRRETYRFKKEESVRRKYKKLERMGRRHVSPVTTGHARALCST
jgi:transposase